MLKPKSDGPSPSLDSAAASSPVNNRPSLMRDPSFWWMTATQFLGAFNDNVFKQLVLLLCVDLALDDRSQNYQGVATFVFSAPFIFFSGFAGYLSDRNSKRLIILLSKVAEFFIMLVGVLAFLWGNLTALMVILFFMGTQSAFFGPGKYGILPELFREEDLPRANGLILMTTFLAIIFGFSVAGFIKDLLEQDLWLACCFCVVIALLGVVTASMVRRTPIANPQLRFALSSLFINRETLGSLARDRRLLGVLLASSVFWMIGGVVYPPAINDLGKLQLGLGDAWTGYLAACTGVGIAIGCITAGRACHGKINAPMVRLGAVGMCLCLGLLAFPGSLANEQVAESIGLLLVGVFALLLIGIGFFAGLFTVPLQVFIQACSPIDQKGRFIGAMNLLNWIGIALSGLIFTVANNILVDLSIPPSGMFGVAGGMMLLVAVCYRPPTLDLHEHEQMSEKAGRDCDKS